MAKKFPEGLRIVGTLTVDEIIESINGESHDFARHFVEELDEAICEFEWTKDLWLALDNKLCADETEEETRKRRMMLAAQGHKSLDAFGGHDEE